MGQFKPMVKMETTEPSVELKLKKGGKVAKKADGGMMGSPMGAMPPAMPARGGMMGGSSPMRPSLSMRRKAMRGMPAGAGPAGPIGRAAQMQPPMPMPASGPTMKKGGKADMGQDKAMVKKAFKQHDMQEHKGGTGTKLKLKHGGKMATGGVTNGQGGYAKGGIINTEGQGGAYRNTKMDTSKPNHSSAKTGGVKLGNGGGYATGGVAKSNGGGYKRGGKIKKMAEGGGLEEALGGKASSTPPDGGGGGGGSDAMSGLGNVNQGASTIGSALKNISSSVGSGGGGAYPSLAMKRGGASSKKAYAAGGTVNSGRPVAMPQGNKKPSAPVSINQLSGTFKKGGTVKMNGGGASSEKEEDMSKGAYDKAPKYSRDVEDALNPLGMIKELAGKARNFFTPKKTADSVTKTKESVTVTPAKKRGGSIAC